jgi:hypothetical protein
MNAPRATSPGGIEWLRSITEACGAIAASTPWTTPTNQSWLPKSDVKVTMGEVICAPRAACREPDIVDADLILRPFKGSGPAE